MTDLRTAAQQALEAWNDPVGMKNLCVAMDALRAALAEHYCDTHCTWADHAAECVRAEPAQEPQCNPHPKAPHGFLRNASHTEDRYVCECEYWDPHEAGY